MIGRSLGSTKEERSSTVPEAWQCGGAPEPTARWNSWVLKGWLGIALFSDPPGNQKKTPIHCHSRRVATQYSIIWGVISRCEASFWTVTIFHVRNLDVFFSRTSSSLQNQGQFPNSKQFLICLLWAVHPPWLIGSSQCQPYCRLNFKIWWQEIITHNPSVNPKVRLTLVFLAKTCQNLWGSLNCS